jgi:Cu/Ag efflux protein CusF
MKSFVLFVSVALALAMLAGPAVAATHQMTGDVRAINADAKTFTLEQHKMLRGNKEHTFQVSDRALLSNLKMGERVTVSYDKQGEQLIAREIHPIVKRSKTVSSTK